MNTEYTSKLLLSCINEISHKNIYKLTVDAFENLLTHKKTSSIVFQTAHAYSFLAFIQEDDSTLKNRKIKAVKNYKKAISFFKIYLRINKDIFLPPTKPLINNKEIIFNHKKLIEISKVNEEIARDYISLLEIAACLTEIAEIENNIDKYKEAIEKYREALSLNYIFPEVFLKIGNCYFKMAEISHNTTYLKTSIGFYSKIKDEVFLEEKESLICRSLFMLGKLKRDVKILANTLKRIELGSKTDTYLTGVMCTIELEAILNNENTSFVD